jgi:sulfate permease, SulP family
VIVDLSRAHVWDASAVAALDAIGTHYARHGSTVEITGLNRASEELHSTLSDQLAAAH